MLTIDNDKSSKNILKCGNFSL